MQWIRPHLTALLAATLLIFSGCVGGPNETIRGQPYPDSPGVATVSGRRVGETVLKNMIAVARVDGEKIIVSPVVSDNVVKINCGKRRIELALIGYKNGSPGRPVQAHATLEVRLEKDTAYNTDALVVDDQVSFTLVDQTKNKIVAGPILATLEFRDTSVPLIGIPKIK
jgi:hypothetical protein